MKVVGGSSRFILEVVPAPGKAGQVIKKTHTDGKYVIPKFGGPHRKSNTDESDYTLRYNAFNSGPVKSHTLINKLSFFAEVVKPTRLKDEGSKVTARIRRVKIRFKRVGPIENPRTVDRPFTKADLNYGRE